MGRPLLGVFPKNAIVKALIATGGLGRAMGWRELGSEGPNYSEIKGNVEGWGSRKKRISFEVSIKEGLWRMTNYRG